MVVFLLPEVVLMIKWNKVPEIVAWYLAQEKSSVKGGSEYHSHPETSGSWDTFGFCVLTIKSLIKESIHRELKGEGV